MASRILRPLLRLWAGVVLFGILLFAASYAAQRSAPRFDPATQALATLRDPSGIGDAFVVDLADDPEERNRGLMHRTVVERPMLFAFPDEAPRSFWMKNTLVPLDIAFFRSDGSWVSSARMDPCAGDPCPSYLSDGPARYALEFAAGETGARIGAGWTLEVTSSSR